MGPVLYPRISLVVGFINESKPTALPSLDPL